MNTVARGSRFEDRVFAALSEEVNAERLGLLAKQCTLHKRKGYFSRDRGSNVIVDISIEVTLPGATDWSFLWVCECKDYSGSLPVNDVEEFKAKLDQIAGKNVKGVLAVTGALQASSLSYAKAQGIGVVRLLPTEQVQWVMFLETGASHGRGLDLVEFNRAFTQSDYVATNQEFFGSSEGFIFSSWRAMLRKTLASTEA